MYTLQKVAIDNFHNPYWSHRREALISILKRENPPTLPAAGRDYLPLAGSAAMGAGLESSAIIRDLSRAPSADDAALAQRRDILGGIAVSTEDLVAVLAEDR
jgi:hypothetical protein